MLELFETFGYENIEFREAVSYYCSDRVIVKDKDGKIHDVPIYSGDTYDFCVIDGVEYFWGC